MTDSDCKIAFVTNFIQHYRVRTFEVFSKYYDIDFYFYSKGQEKYWLKEHGIRTANINLKYLNGLKFGNLVITPELISNLYKNHYDVYISGITGKFSLPTTYLMSRIKKKPFILWTGIWMRLKTPTHKIIYPLTKSVYNHADAIVVYGKHVKKYLTDDENIQEERIFIAHHALDNSEFNKVVTEQEKNNLRKEQNLDPDKKILLYVGRLEKGKGLEFLIEALVGIELDDYIFMIIGTGTETEFLQDLVLKDGLKDKVRFIGYVPNELLYRYYSIAYVLMLPSITMPYGKETWGLVINEAFNQGVPVIATDSVGAAAGGLVENNKTGIVIPERNSLAIRKAIVSILEDVELRNYLGNSAQEVINGWDNERMILGFRDAIQYVLTKTN